MPSNSKTPDEHQALPPVTEEERRGWPTDAVMNVCAEFEDGRGQIIPILDTTMKSALLINSVRGAVRANHYHKTDWHYCYFTKGRAEYIYRPVGSRITPHVTRVEAGQMIFTPPMMEHAVVFTEESSMLTLSRNPRGQTLYEADIVRIEPLEKLVDLADY